jgi:hypothetical protein
LKYKAIVSAHIYLDDEGDKDIEILSQVHNDEKYTGIFDDVDHALLDQIEVDFEKDFPQCETKSYFFMAIVESEFIKQDYYDGAEYDVEHTVTEIKSVEGLTIKFNKLVAKKE